MVCIILILSSFIWIINIFFQFLGVLHAVETLKSLVLTTCCLHQDILVKDAVLLSKMEEEYQVTNFFFF